MRILQIAMLLLCIWVGNISEASAGIGNKLISETAELLIRRGGKEVAGETVETLSKKMLSLAARHGDDAVVAAAFSRVGPRAARIASEVGEEGAATSLRWLGRFGDDAVRIAARPKALQLAARFGDEVAEPLIRHGAVGEKLIERFGTDGAQALGKLSQQNARRLAILVEQQGDKVTPGLVQLFAKHGKADSLADFVWRQKHVIFVGGALGAFVLAPEPFLEAAEAVTTTAIESAVEPVVTEAAKQFPWGMTAIAGITGVTIGLVTLVAQFGIPLSLKHRAAVIAAKLLVLKKKCALNPVPPTPEKS